GAVPALALRQRGRTDPRPRRTRSRIRPGPDRPRPWPGRAPDAGPGRDEVRRPSPRLDPRRRGGGRGRGDLPGRRLRALPRSGAAVVPAGDGRTAAPELGWEGRQDAPSGMAAGAAASAAGVCTAGGVRRGTREAVPGQLHGAARQPGHRGRRQLPPRSRAGRRRGGPLGAHPQAGLAARLGPGRMVRRLRAERRAYGVLAGRFDRPIHGPTHRAWAIHGPLRQAPRTHAAPALLVRNTALWACGAVRGYFGGG